MTDAKWNYKVEGAPLLPPGATSPRATHDGIRWYLETMDREGWEFVGQTIEWFHGDSIPREFWIYRQPVAGRQS